MFFLLLLTKVCLVDGRAQLYHEMHVSFSARNYNLHPDSHGLGWWSHHVVHAIVGLHAERQRGVGALWCGNAFKRKSGGQRGGRWGDTNMQSKVYLFHWILGWMRFVSIYKYMQTDSLCVHSLSGHSRPPLWLGSIWLLSSWSRACLQQRKEAAPFILLFWHSLRLTSAVRQLPTLMGDRQAHLRNRWTSGGYGRRRTSASSRSLSCRPSWRGSPDRFYQWWPDGSRRLGCVQLPRCGRGDQSHLSSLGGSSSTAATAGQRWK